MIRVLIRLLAVLAVAPVVVLSAGSAQACSCVAADTAQRVDWAELVFSGEVVEVLGGQPASDGGRGALPEAHEFVVAVDEVWKGEVGGRVQLVTASNSAACGYDVLPRPGERWVWFAGATEGRADTWSVNICGGSGPVDDLAGEVTDVLGAPTVVGGSSGAGVVEPGDDARAAVTEHGGEGAEAEEARTGRMALALGGIVVVALGAAAGWRLRNRRD